MTINIGDIIRKVRLKAGLTQEELANKLGVSAMSIHTYEHSKRNPSTRVLSRLIKEYPEVEQSVYSTNKLDDEPKKERKKEIVNTNIYEDHIALQKDKIINLEKENLRLKESLNHKTPESSHWDDLKFHYQTEVELHWISFGVLGRTILSVNNLRTQSEILGYSERQLKAMWDVGTKYPDMSKHPIDGILHQDSKDELQNIAKTLPTVFGAIKDMIGNHYIPTKLMYKCKDGGFVGAISYNKIDWRSQRVHSKIAFLIEE